MSSAVAVTDSDRVEDLEPVAAAGRRVARETISASSPEAVVVVGIGE